MPIPSASRRTFLRRLATATLASRFATAQQLPRVLNVRSFGATGDALTLDTSAIQRAIDAATAAGGGTVHIPSGQYITGTLLLKSNVTLELDPNATLLGSLSPADYKLVEPFTDGVGTTRGYALIACVDAHNVTLTTRSSTSTLTGAIDARGPQLHAAAGNIPAAKPFLMLCARSTNLTIRNLALRNSAAWTMHLFQCSDTVVDNVSIRSLDLPNNDGIDVDSSSRVHITGCTIETGDDAICLKTTSPTPCTHITVDRCTLTTRCAAFKIGTESFADFSDIRVSDCHVPRAGLGAIKLLSVDGAHISGVTVERLHVDDADTPIFLRLGARGSAFRPGDTARPPGTLSHITLRDITVQRAHRIGILLSGIPTHPIEDITLDRIAIAMSSPGQSSPGQPAPPPTPPAEPGEKPAAYPEVRMFGDYLPAYGLYARHIRRLTTTAISITPTPNDPRPATKLSDAGVS